MKTTKITMLLLSAALLAVGCSKDDGGTPPSSPEPVTFSNDIDQSRLSLIAPNTSVWSRAESSSYAGNIDVLTEPSAPVGAVDLSQNGDIYNAGESDILYIPAGADYDKAIGYYWNGSELYVKGNLTLNAGSWGKATIYVLDGGSVTFPADYTLYDVVVYSWGELFFGGDFTLNSNAAIYNYSSKAINMADHTFQINSSFESLGNVTAKKIEIVGASSWESPRTVKFGGCVSVKTFDISNYAEVYLSAAGLTTDIFDLHSYSNVYMTGGTLIQVAEALNFENRSCLSNQSTEYAVVDVTTTGAVITIDENSYLARVNGGPVDLNYATLTDDQSGTAVEWAANVVFNQSTYVADNGCHKGFGTDGDGGSDEPVLEHDAVVTSPDIERISATSIDFNNGLVFVSWHEAEAAYQGYIDVVNMSNMTITATLHTYDYDFNHMYINNGVAYVTGGEKDGAFYAQIAYYTGASSVTVDVKSVGGASGNCITIDDSNKWVVSGANGGLTIANAAYVQSYTELAEAKFVEPYNGGMAVLAGLSSTYIYEYDLSGSLKTSYKVGSIAPVDGKNTLHADGSSIYACLSTGGLVKVENSVVNTSLSLDTNIIGSVNCVDTDDEYVYIANGTRGLTIVDKSDWSVVKEYKLGDASANYVKLGDDGYIYVAYGLKGVHRFRLID
ncbi:MAG: hypothetical protein R3Y68_04075 [Rikenellaceae bacterium]